MTLQKDSKHQFNMPSLRRKARRLLKKRYGVVIKLSDVDLFWKQWIKYYVVRELLDNGIVRVDNNMTLEIVGKKTIDNKKLFAVFKRGIGARGNIVNPNGANLNKGRMGYTYEIMLTDKNFREGVLIYTPAANIRKAVSDALTNTNKYYKIVA